MPGPSVGLNRRQRRCEEARIPLHAWASRWKFSLMKAKFALSTRPELADLRDVERLTASQAVRVRAVADTIKM